MNKFLAYKMKVSLEWDRRGVNRTIRLTGDNTLDDLSEFINYSIDFDNDHLYSFSLNRKKLYDSDSYQPDIIEPMFDETHHSSNIPIQNVITKEKQKLYYLFDFGDSWHFDILVQKIEEVDEHIDGEILKSVGEIEQYPEWDDEEDY
ncbi:MAG: plasmid pRiA4b ORF-3 family protein [Methanobrevibacter sp.]|jgi:hypothetical protein|nr:plasmid pRiA4b ORF-3 family protein [Candidatus Methanovirga aequatorialis]